MINQRIKEFWINKINSLITQYSVNPAILTEGVDWTNKINALEKWREIDELSKNIFKDACNRTGQSIPDPLIDPTENYDILLGDAFEDLEKKFADLVNIFKTKIGVDPTDEALATEANGNNILVGGHTIPEWKHFINSKIPNNITLKDVPGNYGLLFLIYKNKLFNEIIDKGIPDLLGWGAIQPNGKRTYIANSHGYKFTYQANTNKLTEYKNAKTTIANAETHLGLNPGELATITTNAAYNLNGKTLAQLLTKEKEIINKIITDLGLETGGGARTLESVITEIKDKITPPTDEDKDEKITELQEQITKLKNPKTLKELPISQGIKEQIIKISQELGLTDESCAKLRTATSYYQLSLFQKQALQARLDKEIKSKRLANTLNLILAILTIGSLITLAWMIARKSKDTLPPKSRKN